MSLADGFVFFNLHFKIFLYISNNDAYLLFLEIE